ncbi:MAG: radical SAM protein [Chloroflexi bacterium]|nr:radical SAM protein [Chloroflexota bacterium]
MLRAELDNDGAAAGTWRVSSGSAAVLGLATLRMETAPTTAYIMLGERCLRNCTYCAQAHGSTAPGAALSRVIWPPFPAIQVARAIAEAVAAGSIKRVCLQVTQNRSSFTLTLDAVRLLKHFSDVPVCCSLAVNADDEISELLAAGADKVTLALDAACEPVYRQVRGSDWNKLTEQLERAAARFPGRLSTHLIVGLGETEREFVDRLQWLHEHGIGVGLFAFTPVAGTPLANRQPPALASYRRLQTARHLVYECGIPSGQFTFDAVGRLTGFGIGIDKLISYLGDGAAFRTSGCPDCNRPYYNERPGGVMYNYPRPLSVQELSDTKVLLAGLEHV